MTTAQKFESRGQNNFLDGDKWFFLGFACMSIRFQEGGVEKTEFKVGFELPQNK